HNGTEYQLLKKTPFFQAWFVANSVGGCLWANGSPHTEKKHRPLHTLSHAQTHTHTHTHTHTFPSTRRTWVCLQAFPVRDLRAVGDAFGWLGWSPSPFRVSQRD